MLLVIALTLVIGFLASHRDPEPARVKRYLKYAFLSVLLLRVMIELMRLPAARGAMPVIVLAGTLSALALFFWLTQLAVSAPYKKGSRNGRFFFAALGVMALSQGVSVGAAFLFVVSLTRHPWLAVLTTAERFRVMVLALVALLALSVGIPAPNSFAGATGRSLTALWAMRGFALVYAGFTVLRAFGAFSKDPTLGIRRVSLRLTMSHVLVVAVPLLIVVAMWVSSTYLGVNADRALMAGRLVQREAAALEAAADVAMGASGGPEAAAHALAASHGGRWPGLQVYVLRESTVTRVHGEARRGEPLLTDWATLRDSLPRSGMVEWSEQRWLGALAHSPAGDLVVLAPMRAVLDSTIEPVLGSRILTGAPERADAAVDSLRQAIEAMRDSSRDDEADSVAVARARQIARSLGLPDSSVSTTRRGRPKVNIRSTQDTLGSDRGEIGLTGQVSVRGLAYTSGRWQKDSFRLTVQASLKATLTGLFEKVRENPYQGVPIAVLMGMGLLLLPLFGTNLRMVRGMGGSITQAIRALREGARAFGEGKLSYRIPIAGDDDLWDTARQFNQMAAGLEHARELEKERDRLENELDVARRIQARLLPAGSPDVPGFDVAGRSESAREVGGDYYDHLDLGNGRWLFVIADVSGKGVPAALLMSGFRAALMSQDETRVEPERVASRINDFLHRSVEPGRFVTAFFGFLDSASGRFVYVNAGHNPPLLRRASGAREWLSEGGLILGIMSGSVFVSGETTLEPADVLTLYTDGVTEGADATGEQWGEERLEAEIEASHALPAREIASRLVTTVRGFEGASGPADDLTVLVVKRRPSS